MLSIRRRTLLLVLLLLGSSISLLSFKSYLDARHEIEELFDARLAQTARLLEGLLNVGVDSQAMELMQQALEQAAERGRAAVGHPYESKLAFQVLDARGGLLLESLQAPRQALPALLGQLGIEAAAQPLQLHAQQLAGFHEVTLGPHNWRLFMLHEQNQDNWILVGERDDVRGELVGKIALRSLLPELLGLPLLGLLVWWAIGFGLRPLQRMAALVRSRDPGNLSPVLLEPLPQELEPMAAAINRLLQQVGQLLERERRFIADAAHELRTPLAVLRIHAQNALEAPDADDRQQALRQLSAGVERATRVVGQLLALARLEPDALQPARQPFDLLHFVRAELAELTPLALERGQELTLEAREGDDYWLTADAPSLGIVLQNLISNAVQYTPPQGRIQVRLQADAGQLQLCVGDSGPGVAPEQRAQLLQRFYRQGGGEGAGLGLSIVERAVELQGGRLELGDSELGGLEVRIELPRLPVLRTLS
jgi:two-component system sensor histidine kinase QseC